MRRFLFYWLIVLVALGAFVPAASAGYSFSRTITYDNTKVPNTNQTDFPTLICFNGGAAPCNDAGLVLAALKVVGSGGKVQNSSGFDIVFGTNITCTSLLNFDLEFYAPTTGNLAVWVKIPSLLTASPTVIYMCYGNPAIASFQGNTNGTWEANILRVYHLPNGTTLTAADSTVNAATGTLINTPTAVAGQIDGAANYVAASGQKITASSSGLPVTTALTISGWLKTTSAASQFWISWGTGGVALYMGYGAPTAGKPYLGDATNFANGSTSINDGVWHYIVGTYNGSNSRIVYVDGASNGSDAGSLTSTATLATLAIGADVNLGAFLCDCSTDEVRVTVGVRGPDWIATEFNNQGSPATFYAVGSEVALATGAGRMMLLGVG